MERLVKMCFNWKVASALVAVGVAVWLIAPGLLAPLVPVLVLAACPLSMLLMMRAMRGHSEVSAREAPRDDALPTSAHEHTRGTQAGTGVSL